MWWQFLLGVFGVPILFYAKRLAKGGFTILKEDFLALPVIIHHLWFCSTSGVLGARLLYFHSTGKNVEWNIKCGPGPENVLDVYMPESKGTSHPVMIFVYGGGWNSGDKFWYAFMACELRKRGMVVVLPNYSLFPHARGSDMVEDVSLAIEWTLKNVDKYGGDPGRVAVVGHSAGGQLVALSVLRRFEAELRLMLSGGDVATLPWRVRDLTSVVTVSAPCDVAKHLKFEQQRHIAHLSDMTPAMEGPENFRRFSPSRIIHEIFGELHRLDADVQAAALRQLPEVHIVHSLCDNTVPASSSEEFYHHLEHLGWPAAWHPVENVGHSEMVLALFDSHHRRHAAVMAAVFGLAHKRPRNLAVLDDRLGQPDYNVTPPATPRKNSVAQLVLPESSEARDAAARIAELPADGDFLYEAQHSPLFRRRRDGQG